MSRYKVSETAFISAPAARIYTIIADYNKHHPRIVPPEYFKKLEVEEGGVGAGTRTLIEMQVLGTRRQFHHVVSEPEPGRVLVEAEPDGSNATTFRVEPSGDAGTNLTISTELVSRSGLTGIIERALTSMMLRRIYRKELGLIAQYSANKDVVI